MSKENSDRNRPIILLKQRKNKNSKLTKSDDFEPYFHEGIAYLFALLGFVCLLFVFQEKPELLENSLLQSLIAVLLTIGAFGAYIFLMKIFFEDEKERIKLIKFHIFFTLINLALIALIVLMTWFTGVLPPEVEILPGIPLIIILLLVSDVTMVMGSFLNRRLTEI